MLPTLEPLDRRALCAGRVPVERQLTAAPRCVDVADAMELSGCYLPVIGAVNYETGMPGKGNHWPWFGAAATSRGISEQLLRGLVADDGARTRWWPGMPAGRALGVVYFGAGP